LSIRFYGGMHYIWCSPVFSVRNYSAFLATPPPTSCPSDIYHGLADDVRRRDAHSAKIAENRSGLITGAKEKLNAGVITDDEFAQIEEIATSAESAEFRPLLYLIPFQGVSHLLKEVPVSKRAHPLSEEYIIEALHTELFDVIELERA
jgi:hypothetical protein